MTTPLRPSPCDGSAACHAARAPAGLAAETGARAVLPAGADLRLRLQPLDVVSFVHQFEGVRHHQLVGLANYQKLWTWTFETDPPSNWYTALVNMGIFGGLYVVFCLVLGLTLAILLDQKIRGEGILRPIYLYPLALSFIVTGTAWKLFLDPRHRARKGRARLGLDELQVRLGRQSRA